MRLREEARSYSVGCPAAMKVKIIENYLVIIDDYWELLVIVDEY